MKRMANRRGHEGTQSLRTKQLGKNFAVFIVGADLRVGPRCHVVHRGRGPTRRSAPTMDNAGLFLRERLLADICAPLRPSRSEYARSTENCCKRGASLKDKNESELRS
jgi:hypothetical protein